MTQKEQLIEDAKAAKKPHPFTLTSLNGTEGREVFIHKMTPLEWRQWFWYKYPDAPSRPLIEQLHAAMFRRCCVDENDVAVFAQGDEKMISETFPAAALREFYEESLRVNDLSEVDEDRARERANFFGRKSLLQSVERTRTDGGTSSTGGATGPTHSNESSGASPSAAESRTPAG